MTSSTDAELVTVDRRVDRVQKAASAALCLVAAVAGVFVALQGLWLFTGVLLVGLAAAMQSYRVVGRNAQELPDLDG